MLDVVSNICKQLMLQKDSKIRLAATKWQQTYYPDILTLESLDDFHSDHQGALTSLKILRIGTGIRQTVITG